MATTALSPGSLHGIGGPVAVAFRRRLFGVTTVRLSSRLADKETSQYRTLPPHARGNSVEKISALTSHKPIPVKGYDFGHGIDYQKIMESMRTSGFQASNFAAAVDEVNRMIAKKMEPLPSEEILRGIKTDPRGRAPSSCSIYLGYASSIITSGLREVVCFLAKHNLIDCIVTTTGGIEEDFIKCFDDFYMGTFDANGEDLYKKGVNRAGNMLIPELHYLDFTNFMQPILEDMLDEQEQNGVNWTPSKMIARMGQEINDESSIYYWAYKNNIPVYCPAITDGAIGDEFFYFWDRSPSRGSRLRMDIAEDINRMIVSAKNSHQTGMITIGAGISKHHICNANAHRDEPSGADYAVYINTGQEFDGSDSGARPDEAVSWGKIKHTARPVKVFGEGTLLFPLLVAETFAKVVFPVKKGPL